LFRVRYDPATGRLDFERVVVRDGRVSRHTFSVRQFTYPELRDWLLAAGFAGVAAHGADGGPLTPETGGPLPGAHTQPAGGRPPRGPRRVPGRSGGSLLSPPGGGPAVGEVRARRAAAERGWQQAPAAAAAAAGAELPGGAPRPVEARQLLAEHLVHPSSA